ncbi:MAG: response regulator, partial [Verrucomicrobiota bacterium]
MDGQAFKTLFPVLIVDDDPGIVKLVDHCLQANGFQTATARNGTAAVRWLRKNRAALILTDLKLPDMMGWEIIQELRQHAPQNPPAYIIMTGQGDERVAVDVMRRGALDYVVKDADFLDRLPAMMGRAARQLE